MQEGWTKCEREINFSDISSPQVSKYFGEYEQPYRRVKHASTGAITVRNMTKGHCLSYISSTNYVAKAHGAIASVPLSVSCMAQCSGATDAGPHARVEIKAIPEDDRGPRLHSEIAFLQDLTGVCDPARQEPSHDSAFVAICEDIRNSSSEGDDGFDLVILIKNSSLTPCSNSARRGVVRTRDSSTVKEDLGMCCTKYLHLFCQRVNSYDWFQQMTRGVCRIIVQVPGTPPLYQEIK